MKILTIMIKYVILGDVEKQNLENKTYAYIIKTCFVLIIMHSIFSAIFIISKIHLLAIYNILITFFYIWIRLNIAKTYSYPLFYKTTVLELIIQLLLTSVCIGSELGFFLYGFGLILTTNNLATIVSHEENMQIKLSKTRIPIILTICATRIIANRITPLYDLSNRAKAFLFIFNIISFYLQLTHSIDENTDYIHVWESRLSAIAQRDELTTLFNRHKMRDFFTKMHYDFLKEKYKFSIAIVDIDDFKHFNDTFGHDAGDFILNELSTIFLRFAHQYNADDFFAIDVTCPDLIVCRWGGEEFLFAQTYPKNMKDAVSVLEKVFDAVREHEFAYKGEHFKITLTGGMAEHKFDSKINETIKKADMNLYKGKQSGKNKLVY